MRSLTASTTTPTRLPITKTKDLCRRYIDLALENLLA
jgi:hypothetical protein